MKYFIATVIVLCVIISACVANIFIIRNICEDIKAEILKAEAFADAGDWGNASAAYDKVLNMWNKYKEYFSVVMRHTEVHDIDQYFTHAGEFIKLADYNGYKAENAVLKGMLETLEKDDLPTLGNIF